MSNNLLSSCQGELTCTQAPKQLVKCSHLSCRAEATCWTRWRSWTRRHLRTKILDFCLYEHSYVLLQEGYQLQTADSHSSSS